MIKLVVISSNLKTTTHHFDRSSIIIGSGPSSEASLNLTDEILQARHLQIVEKDDVFFVHNIANDPFSTLNGLPFGKQPLKYNDCIQIGNTTIRFESKSSNKPVFREEKKFESDIDIEALVKQVEALASNKKKPPVPDEPINPKELDVSTNNKTVEQSNDAIEEQPETIVKNSPGTKPSLKDYYLREYDEDHDPPPPIHEIPNAHGFDFETAKKRYLLKLPFIAFTLIVIVLGLTYLCVIDQSGEDEIKASRAVADIAMALTYAQTKNIHPQNQNWSDPEFIRSNLMAVLPKEYHSLADFDSHGQFAACPYMLRIYTSSNLSQFLVIAQPAPSLLHWIIPKASIIVDSHAMEMRKMQDLKVLNRLLVNANTLDTTNDEEISAFVKQGELIPLSHPAFRKEHFGFSPPKTLSLLNPNAENRIYNAPRYYVLGQNLINRSLELVEKPTDSQEVGLFIQELVALSKFPHLVLYSEGIDSALLSQKALNTLAPEEKFLFGYLQFNPQGRISGAHMLMDDLSSDIANAESIQEYSVENSLYEALDEKKNLEVRGNNSALTENVPTHVQIDKEHPIFLHLTSLATSRQQALKPLGEEMMILLNRQLISPQKEFFVKFSELQKKFEAVNEEQRTKIVLFIGSITRANSDIPASHLVEFVNAAGIRTILDDYLVTFRGKSADVEMTKEVVNNICKEIEASINWVQLEKQAVEANKLLRFESVPEIGLLISYQSKVRSHIIQKLNHFLLSADSPLTGNSFSLENKTLLKNILKAAWIVDGDTHDFYMEEFETALMSRQPTLQITTPG